MTTTTPATIPSTDDHLHALSRSLYRTARFADFIAMGTAGGGCIIALAFGSVAQTSARSHLGAQLAIGLMAGSVALALATCGLAAALRRFAAGASLGSVTRHTARPCPSRGRPVAPSADCACSLHPSSFGQADVIDLRDRMPVSYRA